MKKYLEILKKCPLFENIEENDLVKMLSCLGARVAEFDKHYTVFAEGSRAKYIGIVLSGAVQVEQVDYKGNRTIISEFCSGEIVAEAFACAGVESLPVSVVASKQSEVMFIDSDHVLQTCSNGCDFHRQLIYNLMKDLALKTITIHQRAEIISKRTTAEKLMAYLLAQAKKVGKRTFEIPFDRQGLADYLEVDRSGLSGEIGKLKKQGVIDCRKNRFTIL